MAMISMKISKKRMHDANPVDSMMEGDSPNYPYGLKIRLGGDQLSELSFNVGDHKVGETGTLTAKYVIESMESQKTDQGSEDDVCLQITDLSLDNPKEDRMTMESKR
jgi:hypothetical protein